MNYFPCYKKIDLVPKLGKCRVTPVTLASFRSVSCSCCRKSPQTSWQPVTARPDDFKGILYYFVGNVNKATGFNSPKFAIETFVEVIILM